MGGTVQILNSPEGVQIVCNSKSFVFETNLYSLWTTSLPDVLRNADNADNRKVCKFRGESQSLSLTLEDDWSINRGDNLRADNIRGRTFKRGPWSNAPV